MNENKRERKVIKISKKKLIFTIVGIVLILILWAAKSVVFNTFGVGSSRMTGSYVMPYVPSASNNWGASEGIAVQRPDYYGNQQPSITDTREFLKTNYSASIKTQNVSEVIQTATNIIKGVDGRIDDSYSSEKSGRISFVVPKSKFDAFKIQIENITHEKLITETVSSQNLLNQKQNIEGQTGNIVNTLANLQSQKATLETNHVKSVNAINKELTRIQAELVSVRAVISTSVEPLVLESFRNQENALIKQEATQKKYLSTENTNYFTQSQNLDNSISDYNNGLTNVIQQDSQFTDNIETVNGSISVNWVSLWEIAKIFSPVSPTIIIIIIVIIGLILIGRNGFIPKVEFK